MSIENENTNDALADSTSVKTNEKDAPDTTLNVIKVQKKQKTTKQEEDEAILAELIEYDVSKQYTMEGYRLVVPLALEKTFDRKNYYYCWRKAIAKYETIDREMLKLVPVYYMGKEVRVNGGITNLENGLEGVCDLILKVTRKENEKMIKNGFINESKNKMRQIWRDHDAPEKSKGNNYFSPELQDLIKNYSPEQVKSVFDQLIRMGKEAQLN